MTVKEAVHQLLMEFETLSDCTLYIAHDLDLAIDNLIAAAKEEDILDLLSKAGADGFAEGVEFATMELALNNPPVLHGELPDTYGDSLPVKDMPCGDSCLWGGA